MNGERSALTDRLAEAIWNAEKPYWTQNNPFGVSVPWLWVDADEGARDVYRRMAERVAAELGLTEETQWVPIAKDGTRWPPRPQREAYDALQSFCPDDVADSWKLVDIESEHRWVSAWSEAEQ